MIYHLVVITSIHKKRVKGRKAKNNNYNHMAFFKTCPCGYLAERTLASLTVNFSFFVAPHKSLLAFISASFTLGA